MNAGISIRPSRDLRSNYSQISSPARQNPVAITVNGKEDTVVRASKNIPTVKDAYVNTINVYDLLNADKIVVLKAAMENIQEVYA